VPELSAISIAPAPPAPGPAQPGAARRGLFDALLHGLTVAGSRHAADKRHPGDDAALNAATLAGAAPQPTPLPVTGSNAQDDTAGTEAAFSPTPSQLTASSSMASDSQHSVLAGVEATGTAPSDTADAATQAGAEQAAPPTTDSTPAIAVARGEIALLAALAAGPSPRSPESPDATATPSMATLAESDPLFIANDAHGPRDVQISQQAQEQIDSAPPALADFASAQSGTAPSDEAVATSFQQTLPSQVSPQWMTDTPSTPAAFPQTDAPTQAAAKDIAALDAPAAAGQTNAATRNGAAQSGTQTGNVMQTLRVDTAFPAAAAQSGTQTGSVMQGSATTSLSTSVPPLLTARTVYVRGDDGQLTLTLGLAGALPESASNTGSTSSTTLPGTSQRSGESDRALPMQALRAPVGSVTASAATSLAAGPAGQQDATPDGGTGNDREAAAATLDTTAAAALGQNVPAPLDLGNLVTSLALTIRTGLAEARLHLRPAGLGQVTVQISAGRNGVALRLTADTAAATSLLLAHAGDLRAALAARGIAVADLHVAPSPASAWSVNEARWQQEGRQRPGSGASNAFGGDYPVQEDGESDT